MLNASVATIGSPKFRQGRPPARPKLVSSSCVSARTRSPGLPLLLSECEVQCEEDLTGRSGSAATSLFVDQVEVGRYQPASASGWNVRLSPVAHRLVFEEAKDVQLFRAKYTTSRFCRQRSILFWLEGIAVLSFCGAWGPALSCRISPGYSGLSLLATCVGLGSSVSEHAASRFAHVGWRGRKIYPAMKCSDRAACAMWSVSLAQALSGRTAMRLGVGL